MRARTSISGAFMAIGLLFPGACTSDRVTTPSLRFADDGVVRYVDLEGGFYSIETSAGRHLNPVNLPVEYRNDRLAVRVRGTVLTDRVSIYPGEIFEISDISRR